MWLDRILGRVTCADADKDAVNDVVAAGSKTSKRRDRGFKTTLTHYRMSGKHSATCRSRLHQNKYVIRGSRLSPVCPSSRKNANRNPKILDSGHLSALTASSLSGQNPRSAGIQAPAAAAGNPAETQADETAYSGQKEMKATHE
jgi:hypothetical protein